MSQPNPITLTPVDVAMLKREHIDWEKEDSRDFVKQQFERKLAALELELAQTRDTAYFWRNCFILLASGIVFLTAIAYVRALIFG